MKGQKRLNNLMKKTTFFSNCTKLTLKFFSFQDGFVLVGSVAGQRFWSTMLNLDSTITCGIWTPDDQQVGS